MKLTSNYRRVAVRPFPFTDQIRRIIDESMSKLREYLESSDLDPDLYSYWPKWSRAIQLFDGVIDTAVGKLALTVGIRDDNLNEECYGGTDFSHLKEGRIKISMGKRIRNISEDVLNSREFWTDIKTVLHHELIHAFDPKNLKEELEKKWPYREWGHGMDKYFRNPTEVSAFEGSFYHYFKDQAESGVGLLEAVRNFLTKGYRRNERRYMQSIKTDKVRWRKYLERIYKSAQQAYSDFNRETDSTGR